MSGTRDVRSTNTENKRNQESDLLLSYAIVFHAIRNVSESKKAI